MSYLLGKVSVAELQKVISQKDVKDKNSPHIDYLYIRIGPVPKEKNKKNFLYIMKDPLQPDSVIMVPYLGEPFWDDKAKISESTQTDKNKLKKYQNNWMDVPIPSIMECLKSGSLSDIDVRIAFPEGIACILRQNGKNLLEKCVKTTKLQEFDFALRARGKAQKLIPKEARTQILKGVDLRRLQKYDEALEAYDKALELIPKESPKIGDIWREKGAIFRSLQKYEEAVDAFERALEINPEIAMFWREKGDTLRRLERFDDAIVAYDRALEINPERAMFWGKKGDTLRSLGRDNEAIEAYDREYEINPKGFPRDAWYWMRKGQEYYQLTKYEAALEACDKGLNMSHCGSYSTDMWKLKATIFRRLGRIEDAEKAEWEADNVPGA